MANKQYGLILPKKQQKVTPKLSNVFGDDDTSDEEDGTDWVRKALKAEGEKNKMKKQTRLDIQKALNEDPTIFQYDEIHDDLEYAKSQLDINKPKEKKPKYIENLLKTAERRKKEQEHRIERMVQKEREAEGEMYADKESFVTAAYRMKLEEFKKMEEEEARMNRLEAIGDVTKQQDMSGFYHHLYEQIVEYQNPTSNNGDKKMKGKNIEQEERKNLTNDTNNIRENTSMNNIKATDEGLKVMAKSKRSRQYRQREIETYESDTETETNKGESKKDEVIPSVNKGTDKLEVQESEKKKQKQDKMNDVVPDKLYTTDTENKESNTKVEISQDSKTTVSESEKVTKEKPVEKKNKPSIWEKRTVGPVFEAALQKYYARKAARLATV